MTFKFQYQILDAGRERLLTYRSIITIIIIIVVAGTVGAVIGTTMDLLDGRLYLVGARSLCNFVFVLGCRI